MKKKELIKRIEELENNLKSEQQKYKDLLFEDDKLKIEIERLEYKIKEDIEHCFFFGLNNCKPCKYPILRLDKLVTILKKRTKNI